MIRVEFNDEMFETGYCELIEINGELTSKKLVKVEDLVQNMLEFHKIIEAKRQVANPCIIVQKNVIASHRDKDQWRILKFHSAAKWNVLMLGDPIIMNLPNLLFEVADDGDMRVFATKHSYEEIIKNPRQAEIYRFEYPNMLSGDHICFGSFEKKKLNLDDVDSYINEVMVVPLSHSLTSNLIINEAGTEYDYKITKRPRKLSSIIDIF